MTKYRPFLLALAGIVFVAVLVLTVGQGTGLLGGSTWSKDELARLQALWIGSLPPLPSDPSNAFGDDPRAAAFGHKLFFDSRFSINGQVACGTCHLPDRLFQDGKPLAQGVGTTNRRTMTVIGTAYSPWLFWDGRKDSLWAQALGPMENPVEHGGDRTQYAHLVAQYYRSEYEMLFGPLPALAHLPEHAGPVPDEKASTAWEEMAEADRQTVTRIYANLGKAISAYERRLQPGAARFDIYVQALLENDLKTARKTLSTDEIAGLKLFIGRADCTQCHNGALFTDNHFHNTGVPVADGLPEDSGRALGARQVLSDEFNCLGAYSDAGPDDCAELRYMIAEGEDLLRQFKPPSMRNVARRGPYMHAGQFATLEEVLRHYNTAPAAPAGHSEIKPLNLSEQELNQIIAFLKALDGPVNASPEWLRPPQLPSSSQ